MDVPAPVPHRLLFSDEGNTHEAVTALFPNLESSVRRLEKNEPLNLDSFYLTYVMIQ